MNTDNSKIINSQKASEIKGKKTDCKLNFEQAKFVKSFLKDIPKDLRKLFTPKSSKDLEILEYRLIKFGKQQQEREQVMALQREFNLPLHPNMSLERVSIFARLSMLKRAKEDSYKSNNYKDPPNSEDPIS